MAKASPLGPMNGNDTKGWLLQQAALSDGMLQVVDFGMTFSMVVEVFASLSG